MTGATRAVKFEVLMRMQMSRLRTSWRPYLIVSSAMPLGIAVLMRAVMEPQQVAEFGQQIVAGSAVLAIAMTAVVMLAQRVSSLKENGGLDYYATLPVSRPALIATILLTLGSALFNLSLAALWAAVPVWILGSLALAGLGVAIGFAAPDEQLAGMYSNLLMMSVLFLGILPADRMPGWLGPVRAVLPSTYAVNALRPGLEGNLTAGQGWDLLILAVFGALSFWAVAGPLWPKPE
jgi:ABC-2 type transport system permease protein